MSATLSNPVRLRPARALLGIVLLAVGVGLLCWATFQILRGPGSCGGDAPACPDGFLPAVLGGFASFFFMIPVGIALAPKVPGLIASVTALISGGLAATFYVSRFVADPITDGTVGTWIAVGLLGTISALSLLAALLLGANSDEAQARLRAMQEAQRTADSKPPRASPASGSKASTTSSSTRSARNTASAHATARTADGTQIDLGMDTIRQLLMHGLANGELATSVEVGRISPDHKPDVQRLLDLHARGVIDDDALRDALAALRTS